MLKIRRPLGRLIFNMGIAIPGKTVFLIETAPWTPQGLLSLIVLCFWRRGSTPTSNIYQDYLIHQPLDCLFSSIHRLTSEEKSKFHITGPLGGESTGNWWFLSQRASDAESVSISWRHHEINILKLLIFFTISNPLCGDLSFKKHKNTFPLSIISRHRDCAGHWKPL